MFDRAFLFAAVVFSAAAYLALDAAPTSIILEMTTDSASPGQVFWSHRGEEFSQEQSVRITIRPGRQRYQAALPLPLARLRIDPGTVPGRITIHRIAVTTLGIPLATWDRAGQFIGWVPMHDLTDVDVVDDGLSMTATSDDPYLVNLRLGSPGERRVGLMALLALVGGGACAFLFTLLSRAIGTIERPQAPRTRRLAVVTALVASLLALGVGGYLLQFAVRRSAPTEGRVHGLMLVDHRGHPLSGRPGRVKANLSPLSLYRNAPNQKSEHVSINERGYRGRGLVGDSRPKVVILGGSAAFGLGLDSDGDALDAQLENLNPGYRFVNAGVIGSSSGQELGEMVHYADALEPVLYIALDGFNDFYESLPNIEDFSNLGYNQGIFHQLEDQLVSCGKPESWRQLVPVPTVKADRRRALVTEGYTANLARMSSFARSCGAAFLVLFQPEMSDEMSHDYREMLDAAAAFCREHAIPHLNLQSLPQFTQNQSAVFLEGVHLNAKGNRLAAEAADASVKRLLPARPL